MKYQKIKRTTRIVKNSNLQTIYFEEGETIFRIVKRQYTCIVGKVIESNNKVIIFDCGKVVSKLDVVYYAGAKFKNKPYCEKQVESTKILGVKNEAYYLDELEQLKAYIEPKYKDLSAEEKKIFKSIKQNDKRTRKRNV